MKKKKKKKDLPPRNAALTNGREKALVEELETNTRRARYDKARIRGGIKGDYIREAAQASRAC